MSIFKKIDYSELPLNYKISNNFRYLVNYFPTVTTFLFLQGLIANFILILVGFGFMHSVQEIAFSHILAILIFTTFVVIDFVIFLFNLKSIFNKIKSLIF